MDTPLAGTPGPTDTTPPTPPARRRPTPVATDGAAPAEGQASASAEGTPATEGAPASDGGEKLPDAGFDGGKPAEGAPAATDAKPAAKTKGKRQRTEVTPEVQAQLKAMRAEGKTFMEIHRETNIAIGTIQKYTKEPKAKKAKPAAAAKPAAKAKTKGKAKRAAAKPAAVAAPRVATTATSLKAALFDVLAQGFTADDIRKALAHL